MCVITQSCCFGFSAIVLQQSSSLQGKEVVNVILQAPQAGPIDIDAILQRLIARSPGSSTTLYYRVSYITNTVPLPRRVQRVSKQCDKDVLRIQNGYCAIAQALEQLHALNWGLHARALWQRNEIQREVRGESEQGRRVVKHH